MKLAIVGSRTFKNYKLVCTEIDKLTKFGLCSINKIISGGAVGADSLGEKYANEHNIMTMIFKPDWKKYGKAAGFIRNEDIIKNCDFVLAFWCNNSKGTEHSIKLAKQYNKGLKVIDC